MKTLEEIKQEIAIKWGYEYFTHLVTYSTKRGICNAHDEVMEEYASQFTLPWIKVADRLPENGQRIDTWNGKTNRRSNFMLGKFIRHVDPFLTDRILIVSYPDITHWMPLPEYPEV